MVPAAVPNQASSGQLCRCSNEDRRSSFEPKIFPSLLSAPSGMGQWKLSIAILRALHTIRSR
eukprot:scaffold833_cov145-Skeletonema_menzelii.AAC.16